MRKIIDSFKHKSDRSSDAAGQPSSSRDAEAFSRGLYTQGDRRTERAPADNGPVYPLKPRHARPYTLPADKKLITGKVGSNACLVIATEMILRDHGSTISRKQILQDMKHNSESGTLWNTSAALLQKNGVEYYTCHALNETQLRAALEKGPCILEYRWASEDLSHAIVADKIDTNSWISLRDPDKKVGAISYQYSDIQGIWTGTAVVHNTAMESINKIRMEEMSWLE